MLYTYQIIIIIFAVFALTRVFLQKRSKNFSWNEFFFWSIIWLGLIAVSFSRPILEDIANFVDIDRGVDVLIYCSIIILFYLVYRLYAFFDRQQQEITMLVTKTALNADNREKTKRTKRIKSK